MVKVGCRQRAGAMDSQSDTSEQGNAGRAQQFPDFEPHQLQDLAQVLPAAQVGALADSYHAAVEVCLGQLNAAAAAMDRGVMREQAHDLKGVAGNFGARRMQHMAELLEAACSDDVAAMPGAADVQALVAAMHRSAAVAWRAIRAHLDGTAPVAAA